MESKRRFNFFTKMYKGLFYVGVMKPDGSGERLLAKGYLVEGPTWAPNGRVLMYFKQNRPKNKKQGVLIFIKLMLQVLRN